MLNKNSSNYIYVSRHSIDKQLKMIYMLLSNKNYRMASKVIKSIINNINYGLYYECEKSVLSNIIDECYRSLIDLTFKRYENVHNRVRDMHYNILQLV